MPFNLPDADAAPAASAERALRISVQLQDALETWYLTRTLEMGAHMAGIAVRFGAPPEEADLVVLAPPEAGAVALPRYDRSRAGTALVAYSPAEVPGMRWLPRPARTRDARALLVAVAARRRQAAEGPRPSSTLALPFPVVNGQDLLLGLKRGIASGESFLIHCGHGLGLVVLPQLDKLCSQVDVGVAEVCDSLRGVRLADLRRLGEVEAAKRAVETHRHALPLSAVAWELAWQAIPLSASRPLLEGAHLRLRARPDGQVLTARPEHRHWSELLLATPRSLVDLVASSPDGLDPVARFANACSVLGLLEFVVPVA